MSELVEFWGKQTIFTQGSVGQAMYIIIKGSARVFISMPGPEEGSAPLEEEQNELPEGHTFGARALETKSNLRSATVRSGDGQNEFLVIEREEYQRIVSLMTQEDIVEKVALLRKCSMFTTMDLIHLRELAKVMEPRVYRCT